MYIYMLPNNTTFSVDYHLYKFIINPIAKKICFIHPNIITIIGFLFTIPMIDNLLKNGNINTFMIFVILRVLFDLLDGSVARQCNLGSNLGGILDALSDTISFIAVTAIFMINLYLKKNDYNYNILLIIICFGIQFYMIYTTILELTDKKKREKTFLNKGFEKYIHDNISLIVPLGYFLIKLLVKYQSKNNDKN